MTPHWLMRMAQWARHPPSWGRVKFAAAILAACLALWGIELIWGWPAWLTVNGRMPRP